MNAIRTEYKGYLIEALNGNFFALRPLPSHDDHGRIYLEKHAYIRTGGFSSKERSWKSLKGVQQHIDQRIEEEREKALKPLLEKMKAVRAEMNKMADDEPGYMARYKEWSRISQQIEDARKA